MDSSRGRHRAPWRVIRRELSCMAGERQRSGGSVVVRLKLEQSGTERAVKAAGINKRGKADCSSLSRTTTLPPDLCGSPAMQDRSGGSVVVRLKLEQSA